MQLPDTPPTGLPRDAQSILSLAARSMSHLFSNISQGMFLVDRSGRIVWLNDGYKRFCRLSAFRRWTSFSAT
jgi:PAS domain-containing protein